ncbi:MAG: type II toxin-antitoxin system RelE/ParE family toxin [Leptospirales bacterium]
MKRLIVHHEAELELWQAVDYYETKSSGLGLDFEQEVSQAFVNILKSPKRWPINTNGTSCCSLLRFPYSINYIEMKDVIWIVAVAHMSRKPYYWRDRLKK